MSRADQRKFHYIYKVTKTDTGRFYIGMHSTDDLEDGYLGSGKLLIASIKKHGKEAHSKEIIEFLPSREALKLREKELVNEELLGDKLCMNLKLGGDGGGFLAEKNKTNGFHKLGAIVANRIRTKRFQELLKDASYKTAWQQKISKTKRANNNWTGRKHSLETIQKMRAAHIGKHCGELNSHFGKCWVNLNGLTKLVKIEERDNFLQLGWQLGKVLKKTKDLNKSLSQKQLDYQILKPTCRACHVDLSYEAFRKGRSSCSKACSNKTRNLKNNFKDFS
jgi:hypothetical protein